MTKYIKFGIRICNISEKMYHEYIKRNKTERQPNVHIGASQAYMRREGLKSNLFAKR